MIILASTNLVYLLSLIFAPVQFCNFVNHRFKTNRLSLTICVTFSLLTGPHSFSEPFEFSLRLRSFRVSLWSAPIARVLFLKQFSQLFVFCFCFENGLASVLCWVFQTSILKHFAHKLKTLKFCVCLLLCCEF